MADVKTPDNLVDLDGIFKSTLKGFEKYGILYQIEEETSREVSGDAAGALDSRAEVKASNIKIWVKKSTNDPVIEQHQNKGTLFRKMTVIGLTNINGENQVASTETFENIMVVRYKPHQKIVDENGVVNKGLTCIEMRFTKKTNKVADIGQDGGVKGFNVTGWDYSTGTAVE